MQGVAGLKTNLNPTAEALVVYNGRVEIRK